MRNKCSMIILILVALFVAVVSLWGPELLSEYSDGQSLNQVMEREAEGAGEGYRYSMSGDEKLSLLAKCLNSQGQPESERNAAIYQNMNYDELTGTYAFVVNKQGPSEQDITETGIYEVCDEQLEELKSLGIVPDTVKEVNATSYDAVLYSAIDVLEPRNNVSVWKVSLSTNKQNADKSGRMLDVYIDARTGKIYEFYVRTSTTWDKMDKDKMINAWADYLELSAPTAYESENPLLENTPYFAKYRFGDDLDTSTVVTLGFYEGINELYLKISR